MKGDTGAILFLPLLFLIPGKEMRVRASFSKSRNRLHARETPGPSCLSVLHSGNQQHIRFLLIPFTLAQKD